MVPTPGATLEAGHGDLRCMDLEGERVNGSIRADAPCETWAIHDHVAAAEAGGLVRARFAAWNRGDVAALHGLLHVPHVSLPGTRLSIREDDPLERALRRPATATGWHHSQVDRVDIRRTAPDKAHCAVTFGKHAADGRRYADADMVAVVTRTGGRWGMQVDSVTLRPIGVGGGDHAGAVTAAVEVLRRWVSADDEADAPALRHLVHLPFVDLRGARMAVHRSTGALRRGVARASSRRGRGEVRRVEVRERSARKVTLEADVARVEPDGVVVGCDAVLVIVTQQQGRWALQVHSAL
jgi:hypothetical protein